MANALACKACNFGSIPNRDSKKFHENKFTLRLVMISFIHLKRRRINMLSIIFTSMAAGLASFVFVSEAISLYVSVKGLKDENQKTRQSKS